ncbi:MAG: aromatic ring-hydroxylating dioxygenase subunit alpha [Cyanobacteriota bacterium ELA615]
MSTLLRNFWYMAMPGRQLKPGQMIHKKMLGDPILLGRTQEGQVFAMRDICPHRGIPLSHGWLEGTGVCCCYHGWKFETSDGRCSEIPSLTPDSNLDVERIKVPIYSTQEVQGNIWIYIPNDPKEKIDLDKIPSAPLIPDFGISSPGISETIDFACNIDHAIIGLMDPAHGPYVHRSWWWRNGPRKLRIKKKAYEPVPMGFRLVPYKMPTSAKPYRLLGKEVSIEIVFQLPSYRTELLIGDRYKACAFTAITPIDENHCQLFQSLYWTVPGLAVFKPLLSILTRQFLGEDRDVVIKQQEGLAYDPSLMLIDDCDTQAKWYFRLKQEHLKALEQGREFENPVEARTLQWRS